jgi:hypothetical protein
VEQRNFSLEKTAATATATMQMQLHQGTGSPWELQFPATQIPIALSFSTYQ